jgi:hypothetical protein
MDYCVMVVLTSLRLGHTTLEDIAYLQKQHSFSLTFGWTLPASDIPSRSPVQDDSMSLSVLEGDSISHTLLQNDDSASEATTAIVVDSDYFSPVVQCAESGSTSPILAQLNGSITEEEIVKFIKQPGSFYLKSLTGVDSNANDGKLRDCYLKLLAVNGKSAKVKKIPKLITNYKGAMEHVANTFIPKLILPLFGNLELFLVLLFNQADVKLFVHSMFENELRTRLNMVRKTDKDNLLEFSRKIEKHYSEVSLKVLKGCQISNSSFKKIRSLLSFNIALDPSIILRQLVPKIALDSSELMYVCSRCVFVCRGSVLISLVLLY